jgi:hypothetical protein
MTPHDRATVEMVRQALDVAVHRLMQAMPAIATDQDRADRDQLLDDVALWLRELVKRYDGPRW